MNFTNEVKQKAFDLGCDLVGIANIERYEHAPLMMSPQGILPEAKSVVVVALHHPDGCVEMGGEPHPQNVGAYSVQYTMNSMLDEISFRMGRFLEDAGYRSVPIVSSNIWRYRGFEGLRENFAPDVSHIHAAVAAGLADFGFSGLAMTPEYGPRNRFVQVITTAELEPTPLLAEKMCDDCGLCKKHCPSGALVKELNGFHEVKIEDRTFTYANKNLWRCAWGEHFDLDLDLPIPDKVTEEVILENMEKHGLRGGEFGSCLRFCLPKHLRYFDKNYTRAPRRKNDVTPAGPVPTRKTLQRIEAVSSEYGCSGAVSVSKDDCGIALTQHLPDGTSAVIVYSDTDEKDGRIKSAAQEKVNFASYRIARILEDAGYSVVTHSNVQGESLDTLKKGTKAENGAFFQTVITSAELPSSSVLSAPSISECDAGLKNALKKLSKRSGADMFGVASVDLLNKTAEDLIPIYEGKSSLAVKDKNHRFKPFDPEVSEKSLTITKPADLMSDVKSVIVLGLHYNSASVDRAGKEPAKTVGPYVFARYESQFLITRFALDVADALKSSGHKAVISFDPLGTGGYTASVRGDLRDKFSCRFAAAAAGLASITKSGMPATEQYGLNQTFIAILTDAELEADKPQNIDLCGECENCIKACPVNAFSDMVSVGLNGSTVSFMDRDYKTCDWDKRYFLPAESGFGVMGSPVDEKPDGEITEEKLSEAMKKHDPITKYRPSIAERCVIECKLTQDEKEVMGRG